jgi:hypothetical protein
MRLRGGAALAGGYIIASLLAACTGFPGAAKTEPTALVGHETGTPSPVAAIGETISGEVRDGRPLATNPNLIIPTQLSPLSGAVVRVTNLGLSTTSDRTGHFHFSGITVSPPCIKVDVEASSPGFGTWRMTGIPVYSSVGLELHIQLDAQSHSEVYAAGGAAAQGLKTCH